jgi:HEAT repeat protein
MRIDPSTPLAILLALLALSSACDTLERPANAGQPAKNNAKTSPPTPQDEEATSPPVEPPTPGPRHWVMPDVGARAPSFPLLPGEDAARSRSIGDVSSGYLVNAHQLRFPHPYIAILAVQSERHLNFTTDEMVELIEAGANHVQHTYPGSVTYIGNLGNKGGGDIPYSVSHNSGRDADVAFFVTDVEGNPAQMPDLLPLDKEGKYEGEHGIYIFDIPRNWALIEGFVLHSGNGRLQYIFVADWLRDMILEHARTSGADGEVIAAAARLMMQPRATLAHNDHFHLRIYCSEADVRSGCEDKGRFQPGYDSHRDALRDAEKQAREALTDEDADVRVNAARRLGLLGSRGAARDLQKRLEDNNPRVRAASARALATLNRGSKAIGEALEEEKDPRAHAEMLTALGEIGDRDAVRALSKRLTTSIELVLDEEHDPVDARMLVIDALAHMESKDPVKPLVELISSPDTPKEHQTPDYLPRKRALQARAANALGLLTNQRFLQDWLTASEPQRQVAMAQWKGWLKENGKKRREEWLLTGFEQAGYPVKKVSGKYVWEICKAIEGEDHLSYNAQRVLMRMGKHYPASLTWSKADAYFYWRRWYERRYRRFGAPKIPAELSTLTPKKK